MCQEDALIRYQDANIYHNHPCFCGCMQIPHPEYNGNILYIVTLVNVFVVFLLIDLTEQLSTDSS